MAPESVAQNGDFVWIVGENSPAVQHRNSERREVILRRVDAENLARLDAIVEVGDVFFILAGHVGKQAAGTKEVAYFDWGMAVAAKLHRNQRSPIAHRWLAQQEFDPEREHSRIHADAQPERQERRQHEHWTASQTARGVHVCRARDFRKS